MSIVLGKKYSVFALVISDHKDTSKRKRTAAAEIAKKADVGRLILGHYSSRYKDLGLFVDEAKAVFPNVILASDGAVIS